MTQDYFHTLLLTVVGQAFTAAGYLLDDNPIQQAGGLYRFTRTLENGQSVSMIFQNLMYQDTEWSSGMSSRFRVTLAHNDGTQRDLSTLIVEDFGVPILPSGKHWWTYKDTTSLGHALAEAGHLAIGYGMPYLSGDLVPPTS